MPAGGISLPSSRETLAEVLRYHAEANREEMVRKSVTWTKCYWFMQGVRDLKINGGVDGWSGPTVNRRDAKGLRRVVVEVALNALATDVGRHLDIDIAPTVTRRPGISLDGVRGTAVAQAALDLWWDRFRREDFRLQWAFAKSCYGMTGVAAFDLGSPTKGVYGAGLMLIPPWELSPLPSGVVGLNEVEGVCWRRWVPLRYVKEYLTGDGGVSLPRDGDTLRAVDAPMASRLHGGYSPAGVTGVGVAVNPVFAGGTNIRKTPRGKYVSDNGERLHDKASEKFVELADHWVWAEDGGCRRHVITVGDHVGHDTDYEKALEKGEIAELPFCPLYVDRRLSVGGFYGRGLVETLLGLNKELEVLTADLLQDARDSSRLKFLALPMSGGFNERNFQEATQRKFFTYAPDPTAPQHQPQIIQAATGGESQGRAIGLVNSLLGQIAAQSEMFRGGLPGARIDSAASLSVIAEQQNVPLRPSIESTIGCFRFVYRKLLSILRLRIPKDDILNLARIDESVIGVKYDMSKGGFSLSDNPLPDPRSIELTIRSENPRPKSMRKEQLDDAFGKGLISKVEYRIEAERLGLELPLGSKQAYNNDLTAYLENIILFNDGVTPGQYLANADSQDHHIHLMRHREFMASPVFMAASPEVRTAFLNHIREFHMPSLGGLPEGLETLDSFGGMSSPAGVAQEMFAAGVQPNPGGINPLLLQT
jgi:hypothetical protein